jgi:hypothetical protein
MKHATAQKKKSHDGVPFSGEIAFVACLIDFLF